jgi:hypothetical protein
LVTETKSEQSLQLLGAILMAGPTLSLAGRLFAVWRDPFRYDDGRWVRYGIGLLLMEFLVGGATIFIGNFFRVGLSASGGLVPLLLFVAIYLVFAAAIAAAFSRDLFYSFAILIGGRALSCLLLVSQEQAEWLIANGVISAALFMAVTILSLFPLPRLGIQGPRIEMIVREGGATGHWVESPHCAIGAAAIYFLLLGLGELSLLTWVDPHLIAQRVH